MPVLVCTAWHAADNWQINAVNHSIRWPRRIPIEKLIIQLLQILVLFAALLHIAFGLWGEILLVSVLIIYLG